MSETQQSPPQHPSAASARFSELSARARQAQDTIGKAAAENHDQLSKQVKRAREATDNRLAALNSAADATKDKASGSWANVQDNWHNLIAEANQKVEARQADRAEHRAEKAERHAMNMIEFAYTVVEESEYAILDAILARADADEAAPAIPLAAH